MEPPPNYTRLKAALGAYDSFFWYPKADSRELPFGIGLAIFSKTPLTDTERIDLPSPAIEFDFNGVTTTPTDRLLIGASTALAGHSVRVFNTHLLAFFMLKSTSEKNLSQRQLVAERLKVSSGPTVLGGDFNVSKHASLVRQFGQAGYRTVQSKEITWRRRPYILDHIFYSRHLKAVRHAVKPTFASDHHALVAELEFRE